MLHFDKDHGRWYLVTSGIDGRMKAIPVINDDEIGFMPTWWYPSATRDTRLSIELSPIADGL